MHRLLKIQLLCLAVAGAFCIFGVVRWSQNRTAADRVELAERADPISAISSLSDPAKLHTLKPQTRAVNGRVDKILYWLYVAELRGISPSHALDEAFSKNQTVEPRASLAKAQIIANYATAKRLGLFTQAGLDRLKRGLAAVITKGTYIGESAEIDHIVPLARYPQFANELANLQVLPRSQNRSKGERMGNVEVQQLQQLLRIQ